jgi:Family of unknown function (DUF6600)/FecR protein
MARLLSPRRSPLGRSAPVVLAMTLAMCALPARAQTPATPAGPDWTADVPAHIARVDGAVTLERTGTLQPAANNVALLAGDRLRTARGRAEVLFADGSALDLDESTTVDLLSDSLMRLIAGRIRFTIARATNQLQYRIDAPGASALLETAGEYRLAVSDGRTAQPDVTLAVVYGEAALANAHGQTTVQAGTEAVATADAAPSLAVAFNSAASDEFDAWADTQRAARLGVVSAQYLPQDLYYYGGLFDQYGDWQYQPSYGYVWFPRVSAGWRPYAVGHWSFVASLGWLWVGADAWSWPAHHYGRWGVAGARWFWIPGRQWAPAWVSWASWSNYVSWCPLGADGRAVVAFGRGVNRWQGWTVMPSRAFQQRLAVSRYALSGRALPSAVVMQLAIHRNAPLTPAVARRDGAQPLRAPTAAYAVPRGSAASPAVPRPPAARARSSGAARTGREPGAPAPGLLPHVTPSRRQTPTTPAGLDRARQTQVGSAPIRSAAWPRLPAPAPEPQGVRVPVRVGTTQNGRPIGVGNVTPRVYPIGPQPAATRLQPYPNSTHPSPVAPQPAPTRLQPYPAPRATPGVLEATPRRALKRPAGAAARPAPVRGPAVRRGPTAPVPHAAPSHSRAQQPQHAAPRSRGGGGGGRTAPRGGGGRSR